MDTGSLLFRWALTPAPSTCPAWPRSIRVTDAQSLERPGTPFLAMHAAVALLAVDDVAGLGRLAAWAGAHRHPTHREVVAPLARALAAMACGRHSEAADALRDLETRRFGGSDAQREVLEEARIAALVRAGRLDEARLRARPPAGPAALAAGPASWRDGLRPGLGQDDLVALDGDGDLLERGGRRAAVG